jgi:beta-alanine degradation protein BauB
MLATPPDFIDLTPEMKARLDQFSEEHDGESIGKVGTRIIFEDERVRMWELILEPGEASDLHRHDHDYYLIIFEGDLVAGVSPKGSGVDSFVGKVPQAGNTVGIGKGATEWAYNVGEKTYREVIVELKDS